MTSAGATIRGASRAFGEWLALLVSRYPARTAAFAVGYVSFTIYAATAMPGVSFADWAEAQTVPDVLGIAHPTGYPLFTILGKLASLVPISSVAFRANLLSGLFTSIALATAVLIIARLGVRPVIAAAAALTLGLTPGLWLNSTHAGVHTLHLALVALLVHRLLLWADEGKPRDLYLGALLLGLSFGNHMLTLIIAPLIVGAAVWFGHRSIRARPGRLGGAALAFLAGLSVYLYLPLRSLQQPPLMYADLSKLDALIAHVSGQEFRSKMAFLSVDGPARFVDQLGTWLAPPSGVLVLALLAAGLAGLWLLWRRRRGFAVFTAGLLLLNTYVDVGYQPTERDQYIFTTLLVLAIWLAVLAEAIVARLRPRWQGVAVALLLIPLVVGLVDWKAADQSANRAGDRLVASVFANLPQQAVLYTYWDVATPLEYARLIDDQRPDVTVVTNQEQFLDLAAAGRPAFVLQVFDDRLEPLHDKGHRLASVASLAVPYGGITASLARDLYRLDPP
ncbi:MAG: protein O-mannosyl-transferase family [Candidatus Limnocylindrales bacterium]